MPHTRLQIPGRIIAAPSWVYPASLADNCHFLAHKVDEAGLLFFDTQASLAYTEDDIPPDLADLPLRYHLHLPTDLLHYPPERAAAICHTLMKKTAHLHIRQAVLHPLPVEKGLTQLQDFLLAWQDLGGSPRLFLLENIPENDLLGAYPLIYKENMGVCLDIGHLLAYKQYGILDRQELLHNTALLHLNAPGSGTKRNAHLPLTALSSHDARIAKSVCCAIPETCTIMLELFSFDAILESWPLVNVWLQEEEQGERAHRP